MKIQIEFEIENKADLEEFLEYINYLESITNWTIKKCPKKYKKIVEDYV